MGVVDGTLCAYSGQHFFLYARARAHAHLLTDSLTLAPFFFLAIAHAHCCSAADLNKYVAGGVVVFDLVTMDIILETHLDLSTDYSQV